MNQKLEPNQIAPDGVAFDVDVDRFTVGTSIFIPCINTTKALQQVRRLTRLTPDQTEHRVVIEAEKYGLRVWRVL